MDDGMRVLRIVAPGRAEWVEAPMPEPGPGEVLVKVSGVTTCPHWDLHMMDGTPMFPGRPMRYPLTPGQPGHEMTGEVIAHGAGVAAPPAGTRVAAWRDRGPGASQGCYARYVALDAGTLLAVPSRLTPPQIAPLELAMCVQVSFDQLAPLDVLRGKRFGVGGLGPAGLIAVQMAGAGGAAEVVGIDPIPERRAAAARLGAGTVIPPEVEALPAGRFEPQAFEGALDATGLKVSIEFLMARTRRAVAIFGVLRETIAFAPEYWRGGFALLGYGTHNRQAAERAFRLIDRGALRLEPLVSRTLPLRRYAEGVALLREKRAVKILFDPWEE